MKMTAHFEAIVFLNKETKSIIMPINLNCFMGFFINYNHKLPGLKNIPVLKKTN